MKLSCVILTTGDRPEEFDRAVNSAVAQDYADFEVVVVGNGAVVSTVPSGVKVVLLPENLGVSAGRNAGVRVASGDVVLFLDDDAWYPGQAVGAYVARRFAVDPSLAVISFRVVDGAGSAGRSHVPRLLVGNPERSSSVTTFAGGACAIRRTAYLAAGGLPESFFFTNEEKDLAWRLLGLGYRLEYDAAALVRHHALPGSRHPRFFWLDGRNRVILARRNLPWPLAAVYLLDRLTLTLVRESPTSVRAWLSGFAAGWRMDAGERRPMSIRTMLRMTRAGRPPVV